MSNRGRTLKFTALLLMTALALTGFTTRRGHGSHGHHSGGGGGCSSSHQDHDSSSTTSGSGYDSSSTPGDGGLYASSGGSTSGGTLAPRPTHRHTSTSSPTGSSQALDDALVRLRSCASTQHPYATVEVTNPNKKTARFRFSVTFLDADGISITQKSKELTVRAQSTTTTKVAVGGEGLADSVATCDVDPIALPA